MDKSAANDLTGRILLRDVTEADLAIFFEHQLAESARYMAAFTSKDPTDKDAFLAHWNKILADETIIKKSIRFDGQVVGHVVSFQQMGELEVSYWIGKDYWGQGLATRALSHFLDEMKARPLFARAVKDNIGSIRVLEKCGFTIVGEDKGFANGRGGEVEEFILKLANR